MAASTVFRYERVLQRETALRQEESTLKARLAELSKPISNLVEVLEVAGHGALSEVTRELD